MVIWSEYVPTYTHTHYIYIYIKICFVAHDSRQAYPPPRLSHHGDLIRIRTYVHRHIHTYTHTHTHTYTHTYISKYTCSQDSRTMVIWSDSSGSSVRSKERVIFPHSQFHARVCSSVHSCRPHWTYAIMAWLETYVQTYVHVRFIILR